MTETFEIMVEAGTRAEAEAIAEPTVQAVFDGQNYRLVKAEGKSTEHIWWNLTYIVIDNIESNFATLPNNFGITPMQTKPVSPIPQEFIGNPILEKAYTDFKEQKDNE